MRLPLVLTEADRHLGLANRLLARRARRVCLAFPIDGLDGERYLVTGRPVPAAVGTRRPRRGAGAVRDRRRRARACSSSAAARARGRSTRRRSRRSRAPSAPIATSTSSTSPAAATTRTRGSGSTPRARPPRYTLLEYEPNLADALAACDLVLARAGGSVFELAAAGRPAILVPYPHAAGAPPARQRALDGRRRAPRS